MRIRTSHQPDGWTENVPSGYRPPANWMAGMGGYRLGDLAPAARRDDNLSLPSSAAGGPHCVHGMPELGAACRKCRIMTAHERQLARRRVTEARWREENRERLNAYRRAYNEAHAARRAAVQAAYRASNLEEVRRRDAAGKRARTALRRGEVLRCLHCRRAYDETVWPLSRPRADGTRWPMNYCAECLAETRRRGGGRGAIARAKAAYRKRRAA